MTKDIKALTLQVYIFNSSLYRTYLEKFYSCLLRICYWCYVYILCYICIGACYYNLHRNVHSGLSIQNYPINQNRRANNPHLPVLCPFRAPRFFCIHDYKDIVYQRIFRLLFRSTCICPGDCCNSCLYIWDSLFRHVHLNWLYICSNIMFENFSNIQK